MPRHLLRVRRLPIRQRHVRHLGSQDELLLDSLLDIHHTYHSPRYLHLLLYWLWSSHLPGVHLSRRPWSTRMAYGAGGYCCCTRLHGLLLDFQSDGISERGEDLFFGKLISCLISALEVGNVCHGSCGSNQTKLFSDCFLIGWKIHKKSESKSSKVFVTFVHFHVEV